MFSDCKGRTAIITGGSGGIGSQTALRLGQMGAKILIADFFDDGINKVLAKLHAEGIECEGIRADVSESASAKAIAEKCLDKWERIDILVNCAGKYEDCLVADMSDQAWQSTINTNLNGVFYACRAVLDTMINQKYGKIISLTSQAAIQGSILHAHYAASKAGIIGFSCSLAREVAQYGIYVNCVAPGIISTGMVEDIIKKRGEYFMSNIPLGRFGTPDEVAKVIAFLASDDSSYMTGQTINVTGGWLMHS